MFSKVFSKTVFRLGYGHGRLYVKMLCIKDRKFARKVCEALFFAIVHIVRGICETRYETKDNVKDMFELLFDDYYDRLDKEYEAV